MKKQGIYSTVPKIYRLKRNIRKMALPLKEIPRNPTLEDTYHKPLLGGNEEEDGEDKRKMYMKTGSAENWSEKSLLGRRW